MSFNRFWLSVFAVLVLVSAGFVYYTRHGDYDDVNATLGADQRRLAEINILLEEEGPLTRIYQTLSQKYLKSARSSGQIESDFTRIVADVAKRHNVDFMEASFKDPIPATLPLHAAVPLTSEGTPDTSSAGAAASAAPVAAQVQAPIDARATSLIVSDNDPGDPSIGRPSIDGSLFTRIPLTLRLQGDWKPLVATIQEISTHDVFMALKNPVIEATHHGVRLALDAELLSPAITAVPGLSPFPNGAHTPLTTRRSKRLPAVAVQRHPVQRSTRIARSMNAAPSPTPIAAVPQVETKTTPAPIIAAAPIPAFTPPARVHRHVHRTRHHEQTTRDDHTVATYDAARMLLHTPDPVIIPSAEPQTSAAPTGDPL